MEHVLSFEKMTLMMFKFKRNINHCYFNFLFLNFPASKCEVQNSRVTKSSYETELRKMTSRFELLTRKFL